MSEEIKPNFDTCRPQGGGMYFVNEPDDTTKSQQKINGHMITAVPDLLEACESMVELLVHRSIVSVPMNLGIKAIRKAKDNDKHSYSADCPECGGFCYFAFTSPEQTNLVNELEAVLQEDEELEPLKELSDIAKKLLSACEGIQKVLNCDKDGSYFICKEAQPEIDALNKAVNKAKGK